MVHYECTMVPCFVEVIGDKEYDIQRTENLNIRKCFNQNIRIFRVIELRMEIFLVCPNRYSNANV